MSNQLEGPGRTLSFADDGLVSRTGKCRQELDRIGLWCTRTTAKSSQERTNLRCTKDTAAAATRFVLGMPAMNE